MEGFVVDYVHGNSLREYSQLTVNLMRAWLNELCELHPRSPAE
jgi:hypothetical protein